jgi:manganese/zinc/iron transport system permease protein
VITLDEFLQIDLAPMLTGTLACLACGLLGNFLVLRRQSLMGDAISHVVLPGIVAGFWFAQSRATPAIFLGAVLAAIIAAALIELVRRLGKVESGAAMGVVFSVMFAAGIVMLENINASGVDLDADCVLYGQLEGVMWLKVTDLASLLSPEVLADAPRQLVTLAILALLAIAIVLAFYKELRIITFDPALATTLGIPAGLGHTLLMLLIAAAAVASFEAVGSILVIGMLIIPAATARMLTDRFGRQLVISALVAIATGVGGYFVGAFGPMWAQSAGLIDWSDSLSVSGSIVTLAGAILVVAIIFSPTHGVLVRRLRTLRLSVAVAREDLLAMLYRVEEAGESHMQRQHALAALATTTAGWLTTRLAIRAAAGADEVSASDGALTLSRAGRTRARNLVRTHRLWESYLVHQLGLRPDHVHGSAMHLEHVTSERMRKRLEELGAGRATDPHGKSFPESDE